MKRFALFLCLLFLATVLSLFGQTAGTSNSQAVSSSGAGSSAKLVKTKKKAEVPMRPFSRFALGGGISLMGVNLQAATNLNRHLNLRGTGNVFNYTVNNISTNGFNVGGKVNFATAGASLDFFPFPTHGLRLSPGVLFYNQNTITASGVVAGGSKVTLNEQGYLSEVNAPLSVDANLGLNARKQAFTATIGAGNMIPRRGGHWSFPFEFGGAFTGVPTLNMGLSGFACPTLDGSTCAAPYVDMSSNATAQANLNAQIAKYKSDLNPLQVYPILSMGVSFAFR